jgi:preprotein translocase subunit SecB
MSIKQLKSANKGKAKKSGVDKNEYDRFVRGVKIRSIFLAESHAVRVVDFEEKPGLKLTYELSESIEDMNHEDSLLTAYPVYEITASFEDMGTDRKTEFFKVTVKFRVVYEVPFFSEPLWGPFSSINVPLNTWPYLREYIQNVTARFGLPPLLLNVRQF